DIAPTALDTKHTIELIDGMLVGYRYNGTTDETLPEGITPESFGYSSRYKHCLSSTNKRPSEKIIQTLEDMLCACVIDLGNDSQLAGPEKIHESTEKTIQIKNQIQVAFDRQKSYADVRRGPEFTWEREDQFRKKYPHLFFDTIPSSDTMNGASGRSSLNGERL
ncbi:hypothetical protein Tco_0666120, partial [Tanacetum coccineum]